MRQIHSDAVCQSKPEQGSRAGQEQTFGEQLTNEPGAACAKSTAHGKFLAARTRAGQQKICEIHADDKQDESHSTPQNYQGTAQLASDVFLEFGKTSSVVASPFRMLQVEMQTRENNVGFGLRLRQGDAGLEAANQCEGVSPIAHVVKNGGDEEVGVRTWGEDRTEIETGRQDADHGDRMIVEGDGLAD